jgi:peptide/nickel transport system permease protein
LTELLGEGVGFGVQVHEITNSLTIFANQGDVAAHGRSHETRTMSAKYLVQRIGAFLLTIVLAATLNFAIPRLTPQDPIAAVIGRMASRGQIVEGGDQILQLYRKQFGLDKPIYVQYANYMENLLLHADMGYSLSYFPAKAQDVILGAVPWSIGLLMTANLIAFAIGNLLGALAVWPRVAKIYRYLIYFLMPVSAIPYYLLAMILIYLFAIAIPIFPLSGTLTVGSVRGLDWDTLLDLLKHAALPVASIALALIGFWALAMRGTLAMVLGEDYLIYARAKGLREWRIFSRYAMRNALLPQVTALAIDLGHIVSGAILVEIIFNFPGLGLVLYNAIRTADYFVIQGVVMFIIVSVALATLIVDLIYPLLDPRIKYR